MGNIMTRKTEAIRVRLEPVDKHLLAQIATEHHLDLSDIVRRAIREFLAKSLAPTSVHAS
jgi:uncharacterized protein (DUF1778 family)